MISWLCGPGSVPSASSTSYAPGTSTCRVWTTGSSGQDGTPAPLAFDVKTAIFVVQTAPGSGKSWTFTLQKDTGGGFSDTSVVVTIADAATSGTWSGTVAVAAGDRIRWKCVPSGTPTGVTRIGSGFSISTSSQAGVVPGGCNNAPSNTGTRYLTLSGTSEDESGAASGCAPCQAAGTLTNFVVAVNTAPGSGKSWTFTVYVNGSSTGLSVTIADTATVSSIDTSTVSISKGDLISVQSTPTSTPATTHFSMAAEFQPTTDGEMPVMEEHYVLGGGTRYSWLSAFMIDAGAADGRAVCPIDWTCKDFAINMASAPGSGKSWTATIIDGSTPDSLSDSTATATVADSATTAESSSDPSFTTPRCFGVKVTSVGSPSGWLVRMGHVSVVAQGASGAIACSIAAGASIAAALAGAGALAAAIAGAGAVAAALAGAGALATAIAGAGAVSATLSGSGALATAIDGAAGVSATLTGAGALACTIDGTGAVVCTVTQPGAIATAIDGSAAVSATLVGAGALAAAIDGTATVTASLAGAGALALAATGTASVTASLTDGVPVDALGHVRVVRAGGVRVAKAGGYRARRV